VILPADRPHFIPRWAPVGVTDLGLYEQQGPPPWRRDAACRNFPTELFFPIGHGPRALAQANQAKRICSECPVRPDCLDYALATNVQFGVFGGMSEDERRRARRNLVHQARREGGLGTGLEASA
jgi:WhiB family redox-sensing transcriptional regulator